MAGAVRLVTVQRGVDPTGLALLAFGGAGPLHAAALARELGVRTVVVPPSPGLLCALGLLVEDLRVDAVRTCVSRLEADALDRLDTLFAEMESDAVAWLEREQVPAARRSLERWLDMRYLGQNYELLVPGARGGLAGPSPRAASRVASSLCTRRRTATRRRTSRFRWSTRDWWPVGGPIRRSCREARAPQGDVAGAVIAQRRVFFETARRLRRLSGVRSPTSRRRARRRGARGRRAVRQHDAHPPRPARRGR